MKRRLDGLRYSIFLRIYTGLVLVCVIVGVFAYVLIQSINGYRAQSYREDMASGAFYLITQGIIRQPDAIARQNWLDDASLLLNVPLSLIAFDQVSLSRHERDLIDHQRAVVRYSSEKVYADVYAKIPNQSLLLYARIDKMSEQQIKAMSVFLLDDLAKYPEQERKRLQQLQPYFKFAIGLKPLASLQLDVDQRARLRRKEVVLVLRDSAASSNSSIEIISPLDNGQALVMGPIELFDRMPLRLFAAVTILSLLLISLGVYTLIYPLERKVRQMQLVVSQVRGGNFSARAVVQGRDEVSHLAGMFNNMTEHIQRLIEAQRELTRAVSHELRTPVARIRFGVDMLADTDDVDSRWQQQAQIDQDIESLNQLIDEILTYATLEQGTPSLNFELLPLCEVVRQVAKETRALGKTEVTVETVLPDESICAIAEKRYLHRVVQNLAGNAIRYANSRIRISSGIADGAAFVCVEDDGAGIAEKDREKIFLPWARLDDSRTRASGGYGLGLSIVSRIAFWFGGTIVVDESPDLGGARFVMRWPVVAKKP